MGVGLKQPTCTKLSCLLASKAETGKGGAWILVCDLGPRTRLSTWVTAHPPLGPLYVVAVSPVCFLMTVRKGMVSVGRGGRVKPESIEDIEIIIKTSYMVKISKRKNINNEFCSNKSNTLICIPQFFWFICVYMIFCASVTYLDFYAHHNQQDIVLFFFYPTTIPAKIVPKILLSSHDNSFSFVYKHCCLKYCKSSLLYLWGAYLLSLLSFRFIYVLIYHEEFSLLCS